MNKIIEAGRLAQVDKHELKQPQCYSDLPPTEQPSHECESHLVEPPLPIFRAMEFCFENCRIAQHKRDAINLDDSDQQICKFPIHCSNYQNNYKP